MGCYDGQMGHVIRVDNEEGATQSVLTETGSGGLLSSGYLRDKPATAYLEDDETPVFVLTNQKRGVEIAREAGTERLTAGSGYRTIAVVTDRRLVIIVGDSSAASVDGDQCLSVQLVDVEGVDADSGRRGGELTVTRPGGRTLTIHSGADGLDEAAAYVTAASQAWIHVENTLDDVKRSLVRATSRCDVGEYDAALEAAQEAYHGLNEPRRTATKFDSEWTATAMITRVDQVQRRCDGMLAEVRLGRARRFSDEAESHWRDDEFEAAHDAYERANGELETVLTYDSGAVDRDEVHEEIDRVERVTDELEEAPLRRAVEADRAASEADEPTDAAPHWEDALETYRVVLELDWGADERRFAGKPDQIRNRLGTVVERLISARRMAATKAKRAGDWYVGADQYEVAIEEFETAREQYERALDVARDRYPDATDHLTVERDAVDGRVERARAMRDGESVRPVETAGDDGSREPEYDFEATIGDGEAVVDAPNGGEAGDDAESGVAEGDGMGEGARERDEDIEA